MLSANMDKGVTEYQVEAAISKIYGSVGYQFSLVSRVMCTEVVPCHSAWLSVYIFVYFSKTLHNTGLLLPLIL